MLKPKTYNIADSNIANLGTELEKKVKAAAANLEPAWAVAGQAPGLEIWRIEKFNVIAWPKEQYGSFYRGDSYIVLSTYKKNNALAWDIHFWLGECTTQDEAGTAAYKTVELDDKLGGGPIQHREVCGYESPAFLALFPKTGVQILEGGIESGFRHVKAESYNPRLLHIKGNKKAVRVRQVDLLKSSLNSGDVFILDLGLTVYQWSGTSAGIWEKTKASKLARALDDERRGQVNIKVVREGDSDGDVQEFYNHLGPGEIQSAAAAGSDDITDQKALFRVSDASGAVAFAPVAPIARASLDGNDVFVYDTGAEIFVWIGQGASSSERSQGLRLATDYLANSGRPPFLPITIIPQGAENEYFEAQW